MTILAVIPMALPIPVAILVAIPVPVAVFMVISIFMAITINVPMAVPIPLTMAVPVAAPMPMAVPMTILGPVAVPWLGAWGSGPMGAWLWGHMACKPPCFVRVVARGVPRQPPVSCPPVPTATRSWGEQRCLAGPPPAAHCARCAGQPGKKRP